MSNGTTAELAAQAGRVSKRVEKKCQGHDNWLFQLLDVKGPSGVEVVLVKPDGSEVHVVQNCSTGEIKDLPK